MLVTELPSRPNDIAVAIHFFNINDGKWYVLDDGGVEVEDRILYNIFPYLDLLPNITDDELSYIIEEDRYNKRVEDGLGLVKSMSSKMRIDRIRSNGDRNTIIQLQTILQPTITHLYNGWWLSAEETLTATPTDEYLTVELKNDLLAQIATYIANNY